MINDWYPMNSPLEQSSINKTCKLTFLGAALEVTGSCHLLEARGLRILLDCGMHQGGSSTNRVNDNLFDFDPSTIDMVVLSHAHLDHSGSLPKLVRAGFDGSIVCTTGTKKLLRILLEDSYRLYTYDLERRNERNARRGEPEIEALYTDHDVQKTLSLCEAINYQSVNEIADSINVRFYDAGHILGSAIVEITVSDKGEGHTLVFSGDLGNADTSLMNDPATVEHADVVLLESTYGNRNHRDQQETLAEFEDVVAQAKHEDGVVLIPSFAVGRTQEVLFQLGCMYQKGLLNGWQVFLDSPMAAAVTEVYDQCMARLDRKDTEMMRSYGGMSLESFLPILNITESVEESMLINKVTSKAIVIAGSGMCTGGRIRHHFKQRIWRDNTHVVIVGFQANGTLGRRLVDGDKKVKFFGKRYVVEAKIHTIGGFSAHAGQDELIEWAAHFKQPTKFCLVHGEQTAIVTLRDELMRRLRIDAEIAVKGSSVYF